MLRRMRRATDIGVTGTGRYAKTRCPSLPLLRESIRAALSSGVILGYVGGGGTAGGGGGAGSRPFCLRVRNQPMAVPAMRPNATPPPRPAARVLDGAGPSLAIPVIVAVTDGVPEVAVTRTKPAPVTVKSTDPPDVEEMLPGPSTDHVMFGFGTTFPYAALAVAALVRAQPPERPPEHGAIEIEATGPGVTVITVESGAALAEAAVIVAVRASVS